MNITDNYRKLWIFWLGIIFLLVVLKRINVYNDEDIGIVIVAYILLCSAFLGVISYIKLQKIKMKLIAVGKMPELNLNPFEPMGLTLTTWPFLFSDECFNDQELQLHKTGFQIIVFYTCLFIITLPFVVIMIYYFI